ncbi:MAG: hypothetical protein ACK526_02890 [Planctomyces sp.]|jgi:hypothetical protein
MNCPTAPDDARITCLESKFRKLLAGLFILAPLSFLLGAAANDMIQAKTVTTEKLVIVDASGKERAAIYCNETNEPVLEMYNSDHSLIMNAGKSPENGVGFVQFFDSTGKFKGGAGGNALR